MNHIEQAGYFLDQKYGFANPDKLALAQLFKAYQTPGSGQTQIDHQRLAASYTLARGLSIAGVLKHLIEKHLNFFNNAQSIRDYGGGPGTFLWSLLDYTQPTQYTNIDLNEPLLQVFSQLRDHFDAKDYAFCRHQDYLKSQIKTNVDLSVFSYTLCENPKAFTVLEQALLNSQQLLIVEPGTPAGFGTILRARQILLDQKWQILAPCTTKAHCPMQPNADSASDDWCHFALRLNRTKLQMFLKDAQRGHEDEKFAYLIASREPQTNTAVQLQQQRIISKPKIEAHQISFKTCQNDLNLQVVRKRDNKTLFKQLKKAHRGDLFLKP